MHSSGTQTDQDAVILSALLGSVEALAVVDAVTLHILGTTDAFTARLQRSRRSLDGLPFWPLFPAAERDHALERLRTLAQTGEPCPASPFALLDAAGQAVHTDLTGVRLPLPGGQQTLLLTLGSCGEGAPPPSLLADVLDNLPLDVAAFDLQGRYLYVNPAAIRDPAVRAGAIGLTHREYGQWRGHPARRTATRDHHFQLAGEGAVQQWEEYFRTPGGHKIIRRALWPVTGQDGQVRLLIGYGSDVTASPEQTQRVTLLETMVNTSVDPLLVVDARPGPAYLSVVYGNPALHAFLRSHGLDQLPETPMPDWPLGEGNRRAIMDMLGRLHPTELRRDVLYLPDAHQWAEVNISPIRDDDTCVYWAINLRDVTEAYQTAEVQTQVARANRLALSGSPLHGSMAALLGGVAAAHPGWRPALVIANHAGMQQVIGTISDEFTERVEREPLATMERFWQLTDPDGQGEPLIVPDLLHADLPDPAAQAMTPHLGVRSVVQLPLYGRAGQLLGVLIAAHPDPHRWSGPVLEDLRRRVSAAAMLVEQHAQQERLAALAFTDPLTGLMNRVTLSEHLDRQLRGEARPDQRLAFGLMDLDRFKFLNDGYGHPAGDQLLRQLAGRLDAVCARHGVQALARMGGDEFALLVDAARVPALTVDLSAVFDTPFEISTGTVSGGAGSSLVLLQASLGWSVYPDTAADASELHQQADAAMYGAKRRQVFSQVFEPVARTGLQTLTLETALRESLRNGDFHLVFQPQIGVRRGTLVGAEALLRWTHPVLGTVPPDQFIPVAEMGGLMGALGAWVLRTACQEAARWTGVCLSVNVSSLQLNAPDFASEVRAALTGSGLSARRLVLEVTETGLVDNPARTRETLQALRDEGVRISIDDFGTGYSSLVSVRTLPVDELKIDRSFIHDLGQDSQAGRESRAIVSASVLMAHAMGIDVVAEGVETSEQAAQLAELGCDLMQGWLYAPGLSAEQFARWRAQWPERVTAPGLPAQPERPD
ncbi:EAL domain-containing protein (plasmid) [Deinococcus aquaticus]|uniref:EAL domain-containing protein n=1 Tax=Deinococcus aquaticus TaxID=328692 RepID=A0ABY7V7I3_9DEIO|nr:EAL domain-containing protein [Deinococcus aquaticus]WDA60203.1 EAL domain-containing protein [Deinococcus aquaticus]